MMIGDQLKCRRCGHEWYARAARRPVQCPRCKSPAWDREDFMGVAEARVRYDSKTSKMPSKRAGKNGIDFRKHPSFGMWADRTESDEELLNRLGGGWGDIEPGEVIPD